MDLIVYQMMQFQIMHVSDRNRRIEILACPSVTQPYLTITGNLHTFPYLAVFSVIGEILHDLFRNIILMLLFKFFPFQIDIIIGKFESICNVIFLRTVKHRRRHVKAKRPGSQRQMNLQHLSDIHTGRHAQRIQHDIQRTAVRQIRHILYRQHAGNHTLVTMTAGHLISYGNLSLLCYINADSLINAG